MMPVVWNVAEPLEMEYRQPVLQSSDQSNSGRKEFRNHLVVKRQRVKSRGQGGITNQADSL